MSYHTTTPEILDMLILSLVLVPIETHATTLDLFLTFSAQQKSYSWDSSHSIFLIKFCFYLFTTPQNQNQTIFFLILITSLIIQLPFYHITAPCFHFLSLPLVLLLISSLCLPKSLCQSPSKNLIHKSFEVFSLGCRD